MITFFADVDILDGILQAQDSLTVGNDFSYFLFMAKNIADSLMTRFGTLVILSTLLTHFLAHKVRNFIQLSCNSGVGSKLYLHITTYSAFTQQENDFHSVSAIYGTSIFYLSF